MPKQVFFKPANGAWATFSISLVPSFSLAAAPPAGDDEIRPHRTHLVYLYFARTSSLSLASHTYLSVDAQPRSTRSNGDFSHVFTSKTVCVWASLCVCWLRMYYMAVASVSDRVCVRVCFDNNSQYAGANNDDGIIIPKKKHIT